MSVTLEENQIYKLDDIVEKYGLQETGVKFADLLIYSKDGMLYCFKDIGEGMVKLYLICEEE